MKRITIIGGGASGSLLAINLLKGAGGLPMEINLVEKQNAVGAGVAFSTSFESHLLNVPASKMGAYPDDVQHFHSWLVSEGHEFEENGFVPRRFYGDYVRDLLNDAIEKKPSNITFHLIDDEAIDVVSIRNQAQVVLRSGEILFTDKVVLAFGNFLPPHPSVEDRSFTSAPKYFQNPWNSEVYHSIDENDTIFVIGTGLSMVDVVMHFNSMPFTAKIYAISTQGLLPAVHRLGHSYPSFFDELQSFTRITDLLKAVRRHIRLAEEQDGDWRGVIDSLRPHTQQRWLNLPLTEKRYFMEHLSRYWNVARHRMPVESGEVLEKMQADGRLEIMRGRLKRIVHGEDGRFEIAYRVDGHDKWITADAVVNCIGSQANFEKLDSPLVRNLLDVGHIRPDALSLGLDASPDGSIIGRNGVESNVLYTLGTALKGILWETTAIPEIRAQAKDLSGRLIGS